MLCENCKKNLASTHIKTVINGIAYEKHLCNECYHKYEGMSVEPSISDILVSMLDDSFKNKKSIETRCPVCGCSFEDIGKSGKVGCAKCYEIFNDSLLPYINRVQGSTEHTGKNIVNEISLKNTKDTKIEELRFKLNELVKQEKFEEAAVIRDEIRNLEKEED